MPDAGATAIGEATVVVVVGGGSVVVVVVVVVVGAEVVVVVGGVVVDGAVAGAASAVAVRVVGAGSGVFRCGAAVVLGGEADRAVVEVLV